MLDESENSKLNLEGRGFGTVLTQKAYTFLQTCGLKEKQADLTGPELAPGLRPGTGSSKGEIPLGEPSSTTGRTRSVREEIFSFFMGGERLPSKLGIR